ncbi:MAG: protein O-mannosyl-transferase family [Kiritimatiellia bacterium]
MDGNFFFPLFRPDVLAAARRANFFLAPLCGLTALLFYLAVRPACLPSGLPAELAAATVGLPAQVPPFHFLWRGLAFVASLLPVGSLAARLAVMDAMFQALAVALVYLLTVKLLIRRLNPIGTREDGPRVRAIQAGGIVAALIYATSAPATLVATRASLHALDVALIASAWLFFLHFLDADHTRSLLLAAAVVGVGMGECVAIVPFFAVMVVWSSVNRWRQDENSLPVFVFAGLGIFILLVVYPSACYVLGVSAGGPIGLLMAHWAEWVQEYGSTSGMFLGVLSSVFLILMLATIRETQNRDGKCETLLINLALAAGAFFVLTSALPSFRNYIFASPQAPVLPVFLAALTAGMSASTCLLVAMTPGEAQTEDDDEDHDHSEAPLALKAFGYIVVLVFSAAILLSAGLTCFWLRSRPVDCAQHCAEVMLSELGPRHWIFGTTPADTHLIMLAHERGIRLHVLPLAANPRWLALQERMLRALATDPDFAGLDRARLAAAAALGPDALLRAWLLTDPSAAGKIAIAGPPRIWEACGYAAVPGVFFFTGAEPAHAAAAWPPPPTQQDVFAQIHARAHACRILDASQVASVTIAEQLLAGTFAYANARRPRAVSEASLAPFAAIGHPDTPGFDTHHHLYVAPLTWIWETTVPEDRPEHGDIQHVLCQAQSIVAAATDREKEKNGRAVRSLRPGTEPHSLAALYALARDSVEQARQEVAFSCLARLEQQGASEADLFALRAVGHLDATGGVEQASILLRKAVRLNPRDMWSWHLLAAARLQCADTDVVEREILPAMERTGGGANDFVRLTRALLAYVRGGTTNLYQARDHFVAVADANPDLQVAREWALRLDVALADDKAVTRDAGRLIAREPNHPQANYALALLAIPSMGLAEADDLLCNSLVGAPTPQAAIARARLSFQRRRFVEALQLACKATTEYPSYAEGWRVLADVLEQTGKKNEAETARARIRER